MYATFKTIEEPQTEFIFAECHLKSKKDQKIRLEQSKLILDHFTQNYCDKPLIIAGDFNEDPENEPITQLQGKFTDLWKIAVQDYESWPSFTTFKYRDSCGYQKRTIDYMFLVNNQAIENDENGNF